MKTIIEKNNGYAVTEWIPEVKPHDYKDTSMNAYEHAKDRRIQQLASQPSVQVHPSHTQWAKENLYQPVEDDMIEYELVYSFEKLKVGDVTQYGKIHALDNDLVAWEGDLKNQYLLCSYTAFPSVTYQVAKPKQPVEVKEGEEEEDERFALHDTVARYRDSHPTPPALPVEKEGAREIIASFLFRNFSTDLEPIEDMVSARLMADSLICQLPTAPPSEDWASVLKHFYKHEMNSPLNIETQLFDYLQSNFTLNRKKKD